MPTPTEKKFGGLTAFGRFLDKIKEIFVQKTDSASSTTSGISKLYTTTGNNTDGSINQKKVTEELSDKLPYSGGTLTGNIYTTPYYDSTVLNPDGGQVTIVSKGKNNKGTHPSSISETHTLAVATDKTGDISAPHKHGHVQTTINTSGVTTTEIAAYEDTANANNFASISVSVDASGNISTSAPTPATSDNSTKIATTAYVRSIVPTGGSSGQVLKWSSNGVAEWGDESGGGGGTYTASDGITLTDHNFTNSGVRAVTTGVTNGTIVVNTNGTNDTITPYTHPTTEGNKHIPSGGAVGQLLKYSAAGTAVWSTITASDVGAAPSNIDTGVMSVTESTNNGKITVDGTDVNIHGLASGAYSEAYVHPTTAGNIHIPSGGETGQLLKYGGTSGTATWSTVTASDIGALASDGIAVRATADASGNVITTTYATKSEVSAIPKFAIEVVSTLPVTDISTTTVYLVPTGDESQNLYTEYIYVNNTWEKLGTQTVDLTGYALKSDITSGATNGTIAVAGNDVSVTGLQSGAYTAAYVHPASGATAGSYGPSADVTGNDDVTINVPNITVDTNGHITSVSNKVYTSKNTTYDLMTAAEASTGTALDARSISAKVLHDKVEEYDDEHVITDSEIIEFFDIPDSAEVYY